ncbi:MAG: SPOR domain-containing protein [Flavobacteriales bacterium]|nr:SPOR domain-containing protein [Flavobacteriales bacterium]MCB9448870.1 SPOR domain-containing protein [Flavobacteriales bacterium]
MKSVMKIAWSIVFLSAIVAHACAQNVKISQSFSDSKIDAGKKVVVTITINKGYISGIGKIQQMLPKGLEAKPIDVAKGTFSQDDRMVKIIWLALPDQPDFTVKYELITRDAEGGSFSINGKFSYMVGGEKRNADIPPARILIETADVKTDILSISGEGDSKETRTLISTNQGLKEVKTTAPDPEESAATTSQETVTADAGDQAKEEAEKPKEDKADKHKAEKDAAKKAEEEARVKAEKEQAEAEAKRKAEEAAAHQAAEEKEAARQTEAKKAEEEAKAEAKRKADEEAAHKAAEEEAKARKEKEAAAQLKAEKDKAEAEAKRKAEEAAAKEAAQSTETATDDDEAPPAEEETVRPAPAPNKATAEHIITYGVQIGASKSKISTSVFSNKYNISADKISVVHANGWYKYYVGNYKKFSEASVQRGQLAKNNGVNGAFVIAFDKGVYIPVTEAKALSNQ